jgi:hypothetical protein
LVTEPFVTLRLLIKERDKSQIFLIGMIFFMPIIVYFLARLAWDYYRYGLIVDGVGIFFTIAIFIQAGLFLYLGYWVLRIIKNWK